MGYHGDDLMGWAVYSTIGVEAGATGRCPWDYVGEVGAWPAGVEWVIAEGLTALNELLQLSGVTWDRSRQDPAESDQPSMSNPCIRRDKVELDGWSNEDEGLE